MKSYFLRVSTAALLFALSASGFALQAPMKGRPPSDTPVTTTIEGLGVDTSPTLRVQSDQLGAYTNSSSLQSIFQASLGDWELDMLNFNSSPQRKVLVDLRDPVPGSGPGGGAPIAPFAYQLVRARMISKCSEYGHDLRTILPIDGPITCPLAIAFADAAGVSYRLAMNPNNFIEVNPVLFTCVTTDGSSKCNQWRIEPSVTQFPSGERKNVAKLLKLASKPNQSDQDLGDFYMSFTLHLTNP